MKNKPLQELLSHELEFKYTISKGCYLVLEGIVAPNPSPTHFMELEHI